MTAHLIIKDHKKLPNGQTTGTIHVFDKGKYVSEVFTTNNFKSLSRVGHKYIIKYLCNRIEGFAKCRQKAFESKHKLYDGRAKAIESLLRFSNLRDTYDYRSFLIALDSALPNMLPILPKLKTDSFQVFYLMLKGWHKQEYYRFITSKEQ